MAAVEHGTQQWAGRSTDGRPRPTMPSQDRGRRDARRSPERGRPRFQAPSGGTATAGRVTRLLLAVALWGTTTGGLGALVSSAATAVLAPGPARVEDAVTVAAGGAALVAAWWLAVGVLATVVAALLERRSATGLVARTASGVARRTAPAGLRRATLLALGLTLGGVAAPALAVERPGRAPVPAVCATAAGPAACFDPAWGVTGPSVPPVERTGANPADTNGSPEGSPVGAFDGASDGSFDPGWVPAAPPAAPVALTSLPGPTPRARHVARDEVVVHRGDSLWSVVERQLGPSATAAQVAVEVPRWYAANAATIGPDPDVLLPGQVLRPPGPGSARDRVRPPVVTAVGAAAAGTGSGSSGAAGTGGVR